MTRTVTAIFDTRAEVDVALKRLGDAGFTSDKVSLILSDETRNQHFSIVEDDKSDEGAIRGAAVGGLAGALYLGLMSAGTFYIPGINLLVSGALMGSLAGLGVGGTMGALVGALFGMTVPEHEVKVYEEKIRTGGMLIAVQAYDSDEEQAAKDILKDSNAQHIKSAAA